MICVGYHGRGRKRTLHSNPGGSGERGQSLRWHAGPPLHRGGREYYRAGSGANHLGTARARVRHRRPATLGAIGLEEQSGATGDPPDHCPSVTPRGLWPAIMPVRPARARPDYSSTPGPPTRRGLWLACRTTAGPSHTISHPAAPWAAPLTYRPL